MPRRRPARPAKPQVSRCSIASGNGRRCVRNGYGNPPICQDHARVISEQHAQAGFRTDGAVADTIRATMNGKRVNPTTVVDAIAELFGYFAASAPKTHQPQPQSSPFNVMDELRRAAEAARLRAARAQAQQHAQQAPPPPQAPSATLLARRVMGFGGNEKLTVDMIKDRKRELAMKHHPDRGGSLEKMQAINNAADVLLASLGS